MLKQETKGADMDDHMTNQRTALLDAALVLVPFDGWTETTFQGACRDAKIPEETAKSLFPRGAIDLAVAYHKRGDEIMLQKLAEAHPESMGIREKITAAVRFRLEAADDKEIVRRGTTLFSLPLNAALGAQLIWGTADAIWTALGDTSNDINWYSKRASLSAVYGATVLYWLGDDSDGHQATWEFLDRRIENVMQVEKFKAQVRENPMLTRLLAGPNWLMSHVKAPKTTARDDLPGHWTTKN
jgi:ubiquinone biosynthesis protein COQ9